MTQAENDLEQLNRAKRDLANVYKTQAIDDTYDNGLLSKLNSAILSVEEAIRSLRARGQQ